MQDTADTKGLSEGFRCSSD